MSFQPYSDSWASCHGSASSNMCGLKKLIGDAIKIAYFPSIEFRLINIQTRQIAYLPPSLHKAFNQAANSHPEITSWRWARHLQYQSPFFESIQILFSQSHTIFGQGTCRLIKYRTCFNDFLPTEIL